MRKPQFYEVKIDKLVHGGQGLGTLESGKKAMVWGTLPEEFVEFKVTKIRSDYVEGITTKVIQSSKNRIKPKDAEYLSTSPWQIMSYAAENEYKKEILYETFTRSKLNLSGEINFVAPKSEWHYRGKMEYSFFGDEEGLHLALYSRGTHAKQKVAGSSIARREVDLVANKVCAILNKNKIRASDLKSMILRCNTMGEVVVALFAETKKFPMISELEGICNGAIVVYSNPKSPASVRTEDLYTFGDVSLTENILGKKISYDVFSFFQVNVPIFESVIEEVSGACGHQQVVDFYSGVGAIGLALKNTKLLVESDTNNIFWAEKNTENTRTKVVHAQSERALDYIDSDHILVVDPPRAGLHKNLIDRIIDSKPPKIIYLSCNPSTQARDLGYLQRHYKIDKITGYNFFPRTPHIESLAVLVRQ